MNATEQHVEERVNPTHLTYASPLGQIVIEGDGRAVHAISFKDEPVEQDPVPDIPGLLLQCREELDAYFRGLGRTFTVPLSMDGTEFQQEVWKALQEIPYGQTVTYRFLARRLGNDQAMRAVGLANSRNPLAIIVPCHRVVGASGQLTGYAGGLWRKKWLLEHEQHGVQGSLFPTN